MSEEEKEPSFEQFRPRHTQEEIDRYKAEQEMQAKAEGYKARLEVSQLGRQFAEYRPSTDHEQWATALAEVYARLGTGCLLGIIGDYGTGKTQLGAEAMKKTMWEGRSALYKRTSTFLRELKASWADKTVLEPEVMLRHTTPDLLVFDEWAKRIPSDYTDLALFEVIDVRLHAKLDTILIGAQSPEQFAALTGPSLISRMQQGGAIINCTWPSLRQQK